VNLALNKKYLSGLVANTELHAGGLFFCILYKNCLEFFENGQVELTKKIVDAFRPMDENDIRHLEDYRVIGKYSINERGYLVCKFEGVSLIFTGVATEKDSSIIPFHVYNSKLTNRWSEVYKIESKVG
jgi:hypothetical protein